MSLRDFIAKQWIDVIEWVEECNCANIAGRNFNKAPCVSVCKHKEIRGKVDCRRITKSFVEDFSMENSYFANTINCSRTAPRQTRKRFCHSANCVIIQRGAQRPVRTWFPGFVCG